MALFPASLGPCRQALGSLLASCVLLLGSCGDSLDNRHTINGSAPTVGQGTGGSGAPGSAAQSIGLISISSPAPSDAAGQYAVRAYFLRNRPVAPTASKDYGPCTVWPASAVTPLSKAGGQPVDAGMLAIAGGAISPIIIQPATDSTYAARGNAPLWTGGETLTLIASGNPAGVPAFSGSIPAPSPVALTALGNQPWPTSDGRATVSQAAPLALEWAGQTNGQVFVDLIDPQHIAECDFGSQGSVAAIPADLLQALGPGPKRLTVEVVSPAGIQGLGDWQVVVNLVGATDNGAAEIELQ